jgi:hypothetical protein
MLTKSTDCRPLKKAARQGGEPAKKGVYPVVNDRILQATPTQQAENPSALLSEGFSAFAAFVNGLKPLRPAGAKGHALFFCPPGARCYFFTFTFTAALTPFAATA